MLFMLKTNMLRNIKLKDFSSKMFFSSLTTNQEYTCFALLTRQTAPMRRVTTNKIMRISE